MFMTTVFFKNNIFKLKRSNKLFLMDVSEAA